MSQASDADGMQKLYGQLAIVFLVLTLLICICTLALLSGTVDAPGSLAPSTDVPMPELHTRQPLATPTN